MKLLLLLLSLVGLAVGQAIVSKPAEAADFEHKEAVYQEAQEPEEAPANKKIGKRSYGWSSPWILPSYGHGLYLGHGISYGHGWPGLYSGWSGHGGWSSLGWPVLIGGHGWHGGSHGWHSKW